MNPGFSKNGTLKIGQTIRHLLLFISFFISLNLASQKFKADSLSSLLLTEKIDSNKVRLKWQLASAISIYNPDSALIVSQEALFLAKNISYIEGESRSISVLANSFTKIGNYSKALELQIERLKLEEKRDNPRNLATVLMNIGVIYVEQAEFGKALKYYNKADSVVQSNNIEELQYFIALNTGDIFNRLNNSDSAFTYFTKSLAYAVQLNDIDLIGASMTGLGHSYLKTGNYQASLQNYQKAIENLTAAKDYEILCEAMLGLANLYDRLYKTDSALYFGKQSMAIAKARGFQSKELESANFLTSYYSKLNTIDSAFVYLKYVKSLNDSINSRAKVRESQIISSNEQFRQRQIEETKRKEKEERSQQLQLLLIAIFIPGLFLLTLLLSRVNVHIKLIRVLGVISLLFFFEYFTLLMHPTVANLTNHTPVLEILIFVSVAAFLIPLHHRIEHWLINKLISHRTRKNELPKVDTAQGVIPENKNVLAKHSTFKRRKKPKH